MSSSQLEPHRVNLSGPWQQIWQWPWKHRKDAGRKRCQRMQGNTWHMWFVKMWYICTCLHRFAHVATWLYMFMSCLHALVDAVISLQPTGGVPSYDFRSISLWIQGFPEACRVGRAVVQKWAICCSNLLSSHDTYYRSNMFKAFQSCLSSWPYCGTLLQKNSNQYFDIVGCFCDLLRAFAAFGCIAGKAVKLHQERLLGLVSARFARSAG